jgi:hypothetical protein
MAKGIHRFTADSKQGRSMISPGRTHFPHLIPADIREHNRKVDEAKQQKLAKKIARRQS